MPPDVTTQQCCGGGEMRGLNRFEGFEEGVGESKGGGEAESRVSQ